MRAAFQSPWSSRQVEGQIELGKTFGVRLIADVWSDVIALRLRLEVNRKVWLEYIPHSPW